MHLAWEGAAVHDYDFYLWLNDDVCLFADAIKEALLGMEKLKGLSIIVGSTCSESSKEFTYGGYIFGGRKVIPDGAMQQCNFFNGNFVLIPKGVFCIIGNLDPFFYHTIGDFDYGLRTCRAGIKSYVLGKYIGYCEGHEDPPKWCSRNVPFKKRAKLLYSPLGDL